MIVLLEHWRVVDKWWTDEPEDKHFYEVDWFGRKIIFVQIQPDPVWRIHRPTRK
jgi:hypothetical protein